MKIGFDNNKYLEMQSQHIRDRIKQFGDKLYLEFGGKLLTITTPHVYCPALSPTQSFKCLCS